jgi:hypothetical protein
LRQTWITAATGRSERRTDQSLKELDLPPLASADPDAEEILRVWTSPTRPYQLTLPTHWDDPGAWGILLVDVARHAAQAYARKGADQGAVLGSIKDLIEAEWSRPTGAPKDITGG